MGETAFTTTGKALGITPGWWPKGWTGAKTAPFTVGLAGAGLGKLLGSLLGRRMREEERKRFSNRLALVAGLGAGGLAFGLGTVPVAQLAGGEGGFWEGLKKMYTTKGKYNEAPFGKALLGGTPEPKSTTDKWRDFFTKSNSFLGSISKPNIGMSSSVGLVQADPYLNPVQKAQAITMLQRANNNKLQGLLSLSQLAGAAADLGIGAAAGSAFGSILGLPSRAKRRFSQTGGLAGFLMSRGIVTL